MTSNLERLLDAARAKPMTAAEKEGQRRSFAYGNAKIENAEVTRSMVDEAAKRLDKE